MQLNSYTRGDVTVITLDGSLDSGTAAGVQADLERLVDTSDEWIRSRTGIERRHIASEGETTTDLAEHASRRAMAYPVYRAALDREEAAALDLRRLSEIAGRLIESAA